MSGRAVFFDRDGVLVEEVFYPETGEKEAPLRPEDVRLVPGAALAASRLAAAGYALVVVSNQGAYAKGKTTLRSLWLAHERFLALIGAEGVSLDRAFYAYGHPDGTVPHFSGPSLNRKPGPYQLFIAAAELDLDLGQSWMIGDRQSDVDCAVAAGVRPILIAPAPVHHNPHPTACRAADVGEAAAIILDCKS
jgi:D-glycero-D-manno-heptose 1,7-bisphosphate phosphatase